MAVRRIFLLVSVLSLVVAACGGAATSTSGATSQSESVAVAVESDTPDGKASTLDDAASAVVRIGAGEHSSIRRLEPSNQRGAGADSSSTRPVSPLPTIMW